ncbi:MAG: hypothetical protein K5852_07635 [Eubacterium sp.]|nr:hypothetical protein [Eubacterium sp.]
MGRREINVEIFRDTAEMIRESEQMKTAAAGNEVLILGAFGCGSFRNPPELAALVFREITEEYRRNFEK